MELKPVSALCILAVCLLAISCTKLNTPWGPPTFEPAKFNNAIPEDYGAPIGVTENPPWAALWFQKPDGTITAVFVNVQEGTMNEKVLTIPRK